MKDILQVATKAAEQAGIFLLENFGKISSIESKGDRNFATNLDKEAEKMIVASIKASFPAHGILAEEGGNQNIESDYVWVIDPLDGTHNYMRDIDIFGVSIGVVHKGDFAAGVIYMPVEKELYAAQKGAGATKNNIRIRVSTKKELKECSVSFDSSIRYRPEAMLPVLGSLAHEVFNVRMLGSSARILSYIAEGRLDAAVEFYDQPWDFAAGVCIIREAGGTVTALGGGKLAYTDIGYIASNGIIHDKISALVSPHL